jgi:hypothetical protein
VWLLSGRSGYIRRLVGFRSVTVKAADSAELACRRAAMPPYQGGGDMIRQVTFAKSDPVSNHQRAPTSSAAGGHDFPPTVTLANSGSSFVGNGVLPPPAGLTQSYESTYAMMEA